MEKEWQRIVAWVEANVPELVDELEPGVDRAALAEAERRLSMRLPAVVRTFFRLQNGTTGFRVFPALEGDQSAFGPLALDEVEFYEVDEEDEEEEDEGFEVDPGVRAEFWNPQWIPFAAAGDRGDYLMVDFAPERGGGRIGQVIEWRHDTNERRVVAPSVEAMLKQVADGLEAGTLVWDEEMGVRRGE